MHSLKRAIQRRRRLTAITALSIAASALWPSEARAENLPDSFLPGLGLYIGYGYSDGHSGVNWGAELWGLSEVEKRAIAIGPTIQFGAVGLSAPRLVLGAQVAGCIPGGNVAGELGGVYRFGEKSGAGVHLGLTSAFLWTYFYARTETLLNEYSIGGGVEGPIPSSFVCDNPFAVSGRPLRGESGVVCPPTAPLDATETTTPRNDRDALARAWAKDAQEECSAVAAFLQLAWELLAADAPMRLVDGAIHAAQQEITHAARCSELASHYAGTPVKPIMPKVRPRTALAPKAARLRLAVESWLDGCLGEGLAAARAALAGSRAENPQVTAVQRQIATEESSHASLGWGVLSWALGQGDRDVADALHSLRDESVAFSNEPCPANLAARNGRVTDQEMLPLAERHSLTARVKLDSMLARA